MRLNVRGPLITQRNVSHATVREASECVGPHVKVTLLADLQDHRAPEDCREALSEVRDFGGIAFQPDLVHIKCADFTLECALFSESGPWHNEGAKGTDLNGRN